MNFVKFNKEIIKDEEVRKLVFLNAYTIYEMKLEAYNQEIKNNYCYRTDEKLEGSKFKNEMKKIRLELRLLQKIMTDGKTEKYIIK